MEKWHIVITILCANYFYCCFYPRYRLTPFPRFLTVKQWLLNQQTKWSDHLSVSRNNCVRMGFMCVYGIIISAWGLLQLVGSPGNLHITWPKYWNFIILQVNIQSWFPLGLTDLIFLHFKGPSRVFCNTTIQKCQFFSTQPSLQSNSTHDYWEHQRFD